MQLFAGAPSSGDPYTSDLRNPKKHEALLNRNWSQREFRDLMNRLDSLLKEEVQTEMIIQLSELRKNLRTKHSLTASHKILRNFVRETNRNIASPIHQFKQIERQLKDSAAEITKKKYFLKEETTSGSKTAHQRKRRDLQKGMSATCGWPSEKAFTKELIDQDLGILRQALDQEQIDKLGNDMQAKMRGVTGQRFGKWASQIQEYTIHEATLQKALTLIQQDPKNMEIRRRNKDKYQQLKANMIAIVTNEEQVSGQLKDISNKQRRNRYTFLHGKRNRKQNQVTEKDRHELSGQIEEALEAATSSIAEAFVRKGRPDQAYEMRLALEKKDSLHSVYRQNSYHA